MSEPFFDNTRKIYLASCLYDCIEDNNFKAILKLLRDNNADPNVIVPERGITPFHLAIGNGIEEIAEEITKTFLQYGGNPNIRSEEKLTPVHIAAAWGRLKVLNILINCGGDPTLEDDQAKTALDYAREEKHDEIVQFLINNNEWLQDTEKYQSLQYNITLDKIIINNGLIVAEYETSKTVDLNCLNSNLNNRNNEKVLLPKIVEDSYVENWCMQHANITRYSSLNSDKSNRNALENESRILRDLLNEYSSEDNNITDDSIRDEFSRESGIQTIQWNDSNVLSLLNKSFQIENDSDLYSNSLYLTCASSSINSLEKNIDQIEITEDSSQEINDLITPDLSETNDHITNVPGQYSEIDNENISIVEEYQYVDQEESIVLIEKHLLINAKTDEAKSICSSLAPSSNRSSLPSIIDYDTDTLRKELTIRGEPPGPITKTTKRVYLRKLKRLKKNHIEILPSALCSNQKVYSVELEKTFRNPNWIDDLTKYKELEKSVADQFNNPDPTKRWREGVTKASFTYLLLDPRITNNLPNRSDKLNHEELWKTFLTAIFYVGKGKRSRPYSHLYQAVSYWNKAAGVKNKKIEYILDIWRANYGVVCLHIFQNVIPVEAYTREAAMINALKLQNLCNAKLGDFYGISATWPERQKRLLGVYLLYRAMQIFLNEGERQLHPKDVGK